MSIETDTFGPNKRQTFAERFRFQTGPAEADILDVEDESGVTFRARLASCIPGDPLTDYHGYPDIQMEIIKDELATRQSD